MEPLKTLASCSIALTIWEFYAAFIASRPRSTIEQIDGSA